MMDLEISPDNRFVAAYTNNNQVRYYLKLKYKILNI